MTRYSQAGNALFLILLGVVLMAALTMAVRSGMRGGGNDMSKESVAAAAGDIQQYVATLANEVQRLMITEDCDVEDIDFRNDYYQQANGTIFVPNAPGTNKPECALFSSRGGKITPQSFEKYADPTYNSWAAVNAPYAMKGGHGQFFWFNRKNDGTTANDLFFLIAGLKTNICLSLINATTAPAEVMTFSDGSLLNTPAATSFSGSSQIIDEPGNLVNKFFVYTYSGYCGLGGLILAQ